MTDMIKPLEQPEQPEQPELPPARLWMTRESQRRLSLGGNSRNAVPVHGKRSVTAILPLYTADEMQSFREEGVQADRAARGASSSPESVALQDRTDAKVLWKFCPECGCKEATITGNDDGQTCHMCHFEWFTSVDYSDAVASNLWERMSLKHQVAAIEELDS